MASGGGGCSASERLPPPFPGMDPESEGAAGGSEPEAGDSDTEGEDIFTGAAATVSSPPPWGSKQESSPQKRSKAHQGFEGSEDGGPGGQSSSGVGGQDSRALKEKRTLEPGCPCRGGKRG